jgi:hypothetical protein
MPDTPDVGWEDDTEWGCEESDSHCVGEETDAAPDIILA